jgi:hypothetical protein
MPIIVIIVIIFSQKNVFLVMLGTSSFTIRQEVPKRSYIGRHAEQLFVPNKERVRTSLLRDES